MKILYYNWIQFDNPRNFGGGVNVYQRNLIDYLVNKTEHEIYFLSSGWHYNLFKQRPYIRKTKNIYKKKCETFEIINSSIMAPAFFIYMNPEKFVSDKESVKIFNQFIQKHGPFDVIHFNNIEGISVNVLELKNKYPQTKFIVSLHNYQPICPLNQLFQNHENCICNDFDEGHECPKCSFELPGKNEYCHRVMLWFVGHFPEKMSTLLKYSIKFIYRFFKKNYKPLPAVLQEHEKKSNYPRTIIQYLYQLSASLTSRYTGDKRTMDPKWYQIYREHYIKHLNSYADLIIAVSKRVKEISINYGIDQKKVKPIYIGTKIAEKAQKNSITKSYSPFTIAYLGYERIDKGYFFFIEALASLETKLAKQIKVILAVANIQKKKVMMPLKNFHCVDIYNGYSHEQLPKIMENVNLGIIPVLWEDNLPQVAIEIVACGVPILCSSFGGASELCDSDLFKFKGGDKEDFINHLSQLVNQPKLLDEYWKNYQGLKTMDEHFAELVHYYR